MKIEVLRDFEVFGAEFKEGEKYQFVPRQGFVQIDCDRFRVKRWLVVSTDLPSGFYKEI